MKDLQNIKIEAERLKELKVRNVLTEKGRKLLEEYEYILSFFESNKITSEKNSELHSHIYNEHYLKLLDSQLEEIIIIANKPT